MLSTLFTLNGGKKHDVTSLHLDLHRLNVVLVEVELEQLIESSFAQQTTSVQTNLMK